MDCTKRHVIDYREAAGKLLAALSVIAQKKTGPDPLPVPAIKLCAMAFEFEIREHWTHEGKRRRIREAVVEARKLLAERRQAVQIVANGQGYWLSGDVQVITWYASQRRRRGIQELVAGSRTAHAVDFVGQGALFPEPAPAMRR